MDCFVHPPAPLDPIRDVDSLSASVDRYAMRCGKLSLECVSVTIALGARPSEGGDLIAGNIHHADDVVPPAFHGPKAK